MENIYQKTLLLYIKLIYYLPNNYIIYFHTELEKLIYKHEKNIKEIKDKKCLKFLNSYFSEDDFEYFMSKTDFDILKLID